MAEKSGVRLDQYLRERGPVPYAKAARIAEELLAQIGLLAIRGGGRALSGIALSRILVSPQGQVVLLAPEDEMPVTVAAPAYASPEEIRGSPPDVHSALYSLGCALFELISGRPPFPDEVVKQCLQAHLSERPPDLLRLRPEVPEGLAGLIDSLLSKDPADRPPDPAQAAALLRHALGAGPPPPAPAPVPRNGPSRRPAALASPGPRQPGLHGRAGGPPFAQRAGVAGRPLALSRPGGQPLAPRQPPAARQPPAPRPAAGGLAAAGRTRAVPGTAQRGASPLQAGRRLSGRPRAAEGEEEAPWQPPPKSDWFFTWCGLGLGVFFSLILLAHWFLKEPPPSAPVAKLTREEAAEIEERRARFKRTIDDDERLAGMEIDKVQRVSFQERVSALSEIVTRFSHTAVAPVLAEKLSSLRAQLLEARANAALEAAAALAPEPEPPPPASPAPPPPADAGTAGAGQKDDVGVEPGGDDGKGEL